MNALPLLPPTDGPRETGRVARLQDVTTGAAPAAAAPAEAGPGKLQRPADLRGQAPAPVNGKSGGALAGMAEFKNLRMESAPDKIVGLEIDRFPGAREAYQKLSPQDQKRFSALAQSQVVEGTRVPATLPKAGALGGGMFGGMGGVGGLGGAMASSALSTGEKPAKAPAMPPPPTPEEMKKGFEQMDGTVARNGLYGILAEGKLGGKDSQGGTLLDNLERMSKQPVAEGLDRNAMFRDTVKQINDPDMLHQGNKGTCTVATLEHLNASREPAEYARLMGGLASPSGEVKLRNGETLRRDDGLVAKDDSGRSTASRLYQASVMEYANGALDYDNARDGHYKPSLRARLTGGQETTLDHRGLNAGEWERALDGVLPGDRRPVFHSGDSANAERELRSSLSKDGPVPVALKWARDEKSLHASHALSVEKMDATHVYLRNPWGYGDNAGPDGPRRETAPAPSGKFMGMKMATGAAPMPGFPTGGHIRMTREEFFKNLQFYYVPEK